MSIQAVSWVLSQKGEDLPGTARLVMIALANHADHTSGHCWPSYETIAQEAGCHERTVGRYLGALRRNGFVDMRQTLRKDGKFRSNDYWLLFGRKSAPWRYYDRETEPEDTVADLSQDNLTDGQSETALHEESDGPSATGVRRQESLLEPSISEPSAKPPNGFDPNARSSEQAKLQAAEEAKKAEQVFVFEGSEPWRAWQKVKLTPVHTRKPDGRRGWWFKSLYPPKQTGPPISSLMSPEDEAEFKM